MTERVYLCHLHQNATSSEIKKAYRGESLRWHPDKNPSKEAKVRFQSIAKAYEVLMNETHRELYDHFRENPGVRLHEATSSFMIVFTQTQSLHVPAGFTGLLG